MPTLAMAGMALLGGLGAAGPTRGTMIEGTVMEPGGAPIPRALVVVYSPVMGQGEVPATARTDGKGRFRVETAFPGEVLLCVDAPGWALIAGIPARPGIPVSVTLDRGRTLEGTVRDGATRRPLSGARVSAAAPFPFLAADPRAGRREASSDASGAYRLEHLPARPEAIQARAKGYAGAFAPVAPSASRVDFTLSPGAWISGTIRTAKGKAAKGAVVTATAFESASPVGRYGREETDAQGRFEIVGLTPGIFYVAAHLPGFAATFARPVHVRESSSIDLVLPEATTAVGRLVDTDGKPTAGTILLDELEGGFPSLLGDVLRAAAGPDGRFRVTDLPPGRHRASVLARGRARTSLKFETHEGAELDLGDVPLAGGLAIRGRIRDAKRVPVAGLRIDAVSIDGQGGYAADSTDGEGTFALAGLGDGRYRLTATTGSVVRASREVGAGGEPVDWTLEPTGAATGEVIDATGRPVDSFHVSARSLDQDTVGWGSPHTTGTGGAFRIENVAAGRYALRVTAPDHADAVSSVIVAAERTTDIGRVRLGPVGRVHGTVVDAAGRPVAGAEVTASSQRDHESGHLSHHTPQARTTQEGAFEIGGLNPGSINIEVHHTRQGSGRAGGVVVDPNQGPAAVRVVLEPSGRLEGKIRRRGKGLAATVHAMPLRFARERAATLTEEDGSFALENLPPGTFMLTFASVAQPGQVLPERPVEVRPGETTVVDIDVREILIRGRVTRAGGGTEGLRVDFDHEGRHTGRPLKEGAGPQPMVSSVAADGSYALVVSEPGAYQARVENPDGTVLHHRAVAVPEGDEHRLDLDFASIRVTGMLVDEATREPVAGGELSVVRKGSSDIGRPARSGPDGRFDFPLEPGDYVLYVRADGYARSQWPLEVGAQGVAERRLSLRRGFEARGRVVDAGGQGVAAVQVFATGDRSPEPIAHGQTAADGSFELRGLDNAAYNLLAGSELAGFAIQQGVKPEASEVVLALQRPGRVRVTVRDAAGAPASGAFFVITGVDDAPVFGIASFLSSTDGNGVVELGLPVGRVELTAQRGPSNGSTVVEVRPGELAEATLTLSTSKASP